MIVRNKKIVQEKETRKPLMLLFDGKDSALEDYFTKAPEKTGWSEDVLNQLKGAASTNEYYAQDYLDKIDPLTESQLKSIYPNASPTVMLDPLKATTKTRLHDNVRRDGSTFRGLLFLVYFLLGKEISLVFDVNRKFANAKRRDEELKAIEENGDYLAILEDLMNRDDDVDLFNRMAELVFSAEAFGRSVQIKKYDKKGFPCELIPLSSPRLGRVFVDRKTWRFLGVEYLDYPKSNNILPYKDIIHHEVNDFHITPNSRYFGIPSIESTMSIGERNRSANEIAVPEIMKRMFAPLQLVKTNTKSEAKLLEIKNKWRPGKTLFINDDIEVTVVPLQHDLEKIQTAVMEGSKDIYRGLTVPLVVAFQDEQNRATAEETMNQWYESVLAFKRNQLNNLMWLQWYKPQLMKIFEDRTMERVALEGNALSYLMDKARNPEQYEILPFRVRLEFANVNPTSKIEIAKSVLGAFDRNLLSPEITRKELGYGQYEQDMKAYELAKTAAPTLMPSQNMNMFSSEQQQQQEQEGSMMGGLRGITATENTGLETAEKTEDVI